MVLLIMKDFVLFLQGLALPGEAFALVQCLIGIILLLAILGSPLWIVLAIINRLFTNRR